MENNKMIDIFNKILKSFDLKPITELPEQESLENETDKHVLCSKLSYIMMDVVKDQDLNKGGLKNLRNRSKTDRIKIQNNPEDRAIFNILGSCVLKTCIDDDVFKLNLTHVYYGEKISIDGEGDCHKALTKDLLYTIYSSVIIQLFNVLIKKELMNE